jgi:hypothetical protein
MRSSFDGDAGGAELPRRVVPRDDQEAPKLDELVVRDPRNLVPSAQRDAVGGGAVDVEKNALREERRRH